MSPELGYALLLVGLALGALATWWLMRLRIADAHRIGMAEGEAERAEQATIAKRVPELEARINGMQEERTQLVARAADAATSSDQQRAHTQERLQLLERAREQLSASFQALSAQSLRENNQSFLTLASETFARIQDAARADFDSRGKAVEVLVKPVNESLARVAATVQELESQRGQALAALAAQVTGLRSAQENLASETARLTNALRAPVVGGRWGELQLRRVVEMAGMVEHCDFTTQESLGATESRQRPDLIVRLPGGARVVVDAKAPIQSYLAATEATDEAARRALLEDYALKVRAHLQALSSKSYQEQFSAGGAPDFVVLFLPGEPYFSAALQQDPTLIEHGVRANIIIATPITLIALLRAVAYGWRQEQLARNSQEIADLGRALYTRMRAFTEHLGDIGKHLERATRSFNQSVGSLEQSVMPSARRLREAGATGPGDAEIPTLSPTDQAVRALRTERRG